MNTVGLLGGMSWESTALYYQHLNRMVREARGGLNSAPVIIDSVNFAQMADWQRQGQWQTAADDLAQRARHLQNSGARAIAIATNTMHKVADTIQAAIDIPLIHIADAVCDAALAQGITRVLFMGTQFSMSDGFLEQRYAARGVQWVLPSEAERAQIHSMIFERLCQGEVLDADRQVLRDIVARHIEVASDNAPQALVLGCTELVMLLNDAHPCDLPLLDSTLIHAQTIAQVILSGDSQ